MGGVDFVGENQNLTPQTYFFGESVLSCDLSIKMKINFVVKISLIIGLNNQIL